MRAVQPDALPLPPAPLPEYQARGEKGIEVFECRALAAHVSEHGVVRGRSRKGMSKVEHEINKDAYSGPVAAGAIQSAGQGGETVWKDELTPQERIRYTDKFDDPNLPGEMQTTITLKPVSCGTELNIVQEGVPGAIPAEACYLGWQESLTLLAKLVEAEIPD